MSGTVVLLRHGESQWNSLGKWTGWTDVDLTDAGVKEAQAMGEQLKDIHFDHVYTSKLQRAIHTAENVLKTQGQTDLPLSEVAAINERDYGDYTGKNKWEVKAEVGDEKFNAIRRNFDEPIPNGETLHMVYDRAVPWFKETVVPELEKDENVLLVGHGNSMRSLVKYIESISDDGISKFEMPLGMILEYTVDDNGKMTSRKELHVATGASKA